MSKLRAGRRACRMLGLIEVFGGMPTREESQQPTWPHDRHSRSATQKVPSVRHSAHALAVFCGVSLPSSIPSDVHKPRPYILR